jgi:hypothetical protein
MGLEGKGRECQTLLRGKAWKEHGPRRERDNIIYFGKGNGVMNTGLDGICRE